MTVQAADRIMLCPVGPEALRPFLAAPPQAEEAVRLSLYLPTHRQVPENRVDLPVFDHLVEACTLALALDHRPQEVERLLEPFRLLAGDRRFWQHTRDGLALLAEDGRAWAFLLQRPVPPLALVASRFHTLPLVRLAASLDRFHVLALTSRTATLHEGTVWHDAHGAAGGQFDPLLLTRRVGGRERTSDRIERDEVVDAETFQPHRVQRGLGTAGIVHGGAGSKDDDIDADTEIFLRYVARTVAERVSRPAGLPLVLVAAPRLAALVRQEAKNPWLVAESVAKDPALMTPERLAAEVLPVITAARARRTAHAVAAFTAARAHGLAQGDLSDVARAAVAGRVARLLIETDRFEPGRLDRHTGAITSVGGPPPDLSRSGDVPAVRGEDLFGAVAEMVVLDGGEIVALSRNDMPTESGVAAIYRY